MELYTLDRAFKKQDLIEEFKSIIWAERYYGDSNVEIIVPLHSKSIEKLPLGKFVSLLGSNEIMILESVDIDAEVKFTGISLLSWLNNRFVRSSESHEDKTWTLENMKAGEVLWTMVQAMCTAGSPYLDGTISTGIPVQYAKQLVIPELGLHDYDSSGDFLKVAIPFGPLYDAMKEIAIASQVGMQIIQETDPEATHILGFRSYRGLNRTYTQSENSIVRFSPFLDSLANVKEFQSLAALKTLIFAFASEAADNLGGPGIAFLEGEDISGFDLRALEIFVDGISVDVPDSEIITILSERARTALGANPYIQGVDGEIISTNMFKYGVDYNLGDLVELQGNSEAVVIARVTEYIRAQDSTGEREYPTVEVLEGG